MAEPDRSARRSVNEAFLVGTEPQTLCYTHLGVPGGSLTHLPQLVQVPVGQPASRTARTLGPHVCILVCRFSLLRLPL